MLPRGEGERPPPNDVHCVKVHYSIMHIVSTPYNQSHDYSMIHCACRRCAFFEQRESMRLSSNILFSAASVATYGILTVVWMSVVGLYSTVYSVRDMIVRCTLYAVHCTLHRPGTKRRIISSIRPYRSSPDAALVSSSPPSSRIRNSEVLEFMGTIHRARRSPYNFETTKFSANRRQS